MSTEIKNVVIAGASGNLGTPVLHVLLESSLNVSVLCRESSKSKFPSTVRVLTTDYSQASLEIALKGQDAVISTIGYESLGEGAMNLINAAAEVGVKRFLPSEFGHNTVCDKIRPWIPFFGEKVNLVNRLDALGESSSITWTAIIPGVFFDWGLELFISMNLKNRKATIWDAGDVPFAASTLDLIGRTILKLLTDPAAYEASRNKYIYTASATTTQSEVLRAVEKVTGTKFNIEKVDGQKTLVESRRKVANGDKSATLVLLQTIAFARIDGDAVADYRKYGIFNESFGVSDPSVEEIIADTIAMQRNK
ncbi:MAG: hypothetical protein M1820_009006 [Bogoriella megaspora]|nr:MAG: hypothetical protein M1820_009006 [Bogoriella megaspora]